MRDAEEVPCPPGARELPVRSAAGGTPYGRAPRRRAMRAGTASGACETLRADPQQQNTDAAVAADLGESVVVGGHAVESVDDLVPCARRDVVDDQDRARAQQPAERLHLLGQVLTG